MNIRKAAEKDLEQINHIYNWHSENGFSTFSETTTLNERRKWFVRFDSPEHVALVSENDGSVNLGCVEQLDPLKLEIKVLDGKSMPISNEPGPNPTKNHSSGEGSHKK